MGANPFVPETMSHPAFPCKAVGTRIHQRFVRGLNHLCAASGCPQPTRSHRKVRVTGFESSTNFQYSSFDPSELN